MRFFYEKAASVLLHSIVAVPTAHNKKNCRITINKWQQLLKPEENLIIDNLAGDEKPAKVRKTKEIAFFIALLIVESYNPKKILLPVKTKKPPLKIGAAFK